MTEIKAVYAAGDKTFDTKAEAVDYLRRPLIQEAFEAVTGNSDVIEWLMENQECVEAAFDTGTIKRVTKVEKKKLDKALDLLKESDEPGFAFLVENVDAISSSFRWPSVKRMTDEEKVSAAKLAIVAESDDEALADWIIANKEAVIECYKAGVVKRTVHPNAQSGLAKYKEEKAAEKAAKEAAAAKLAAEQEPAVE